MHMAQIRIDRTLHPSVRVWEAIKNEPFWWWFAHKERPIITYLDKNTIKKAGTRKSEPILWSGAFSNELTDSCVRKWRVRATFLLIFFSFCLPRFVSHGITSQLWLKTSRKRRCHWIEYCNSFFSVQKSAEIARQREGQYLSTHLAK